ncbi:MAG: hypothetical protein ABII89_07730, partial [Candidatus Omnitrophota bacterium]
MKTGRIFFLFVSMLVCVSAQCLLAATPKNLGVDVNGQDADISEPLAIDTWHTITAKYRYADNFDLLTNTYLVICRGSNQLGGFYIGYNLPRNELAIVKHGFWNATEATGHPGEAGRIIENDQGYLDCENTKIEKA